MAKSNGAKVDLVIYEGCVVLASRGAPENLTATQLVAQHSASRMIEDATVVDVVVREDALSGGATLALRNGDTLALTWPGRRNRGVSAENLFADAFPRKVDQGSSPVTARTVKAMAVLGGLGLLVVAAWIGVSTLLAKDTPPPPPPAPAVTVPPAEQAARAELEGACGMWTSFAQGLAAGDRPDPARLRPLVDALKPRLDAATSAVAAYGPARDEAAYLQDYVRRPADAIARESSGRVTYAVSTISAACARAAAPPSS